MTDRDEFIKRVQDTLAGYLSGAITGKRMVAAYDRLMADAVPDGLDRTAEMFKLLDQYQDEFALYVENPTWRSEHHSYYGDDELREKVKALHEILSSELEKE